MFLLKSYCNFLRIFRVHVFQAKSDEPLPKVTSSNYDSLLSLVREFETKGGVREVSACLHKDHGTFVIVPQSDIATEYLLRIISGSELTEGNNALQLSNLFSPPHDAQQLQTHV